MEGPDRWKVVGPNGTVEDGTIPREGIHGKTVSETEKKYRNFHAYPLQVRDAEQQRFLLSLRH
jgi:hypothetical protein